MGQVASKAVGLGCLFVWILTGGSAWGTEDEQLSRPNWLQVVSRIVAVQAKDDANIPWPPGGHGLIEVVNDQCYLVTPYHVVERREGPRSVPKREISVIGRNGERVVVDSSFFASSSFVRLADDLAAFMVLGEGREKVCQGFDNTWAGDTPGDVIVLRGLNGRLEQIGVRFRTMDAGEAMLLLDDPGHVSALKGWSGATYMADRTRKAMVLEVRNPDEHHIVAMPATTIDALFVEKVIAPSLRPERSVRAMPPPNVLYDASWAVVSVTFDVTREGHVANVRAYENADPFHRQAAEQAVRRWKFKPVQRNGRPLPVPDVTALVPVDDGYTVEAGTGGDWYVYQETQLRIGPADDYRSIGNLPVNARVTVTGSVPEEPEWRRVVIDDGRRGFMRGTLLCAQKKRFQGMTLRECEECPQVVVLPEGQFKQGSPEAERGRDNDEGPLREVSVRPFAVGRFEVTWAEWAACVQDGGCRESTGRAVGGDDSRSGGAFPVVGVSWVDASRYTAWVSGKTGEAYRLLTEAEWEYAARSGRQTRYGWGDQAPVCQTDAPNGAKFGGCVDFGPAPVGSFPANDYGLYDMHGNVWEWVSDCYSGPYDSAEIPDASVPLPESAGCLRVVRGGASGNSARQLRAAYRHWHRAEDRVDELGFRVGRTISACQTFAHTPDSAL